MTLHRRPAVATQAISLVDGDALFFRANEKSVSLIMECEHSVGPLATYGALVSAIQGSLQRSVSRMEEDGLNFGWVH
jgi:hypothetical protein